MTLALRALLAAALASAALGCERGHAPAADGTRGPADSASVARAASHDASPPAPSADTAPDPLPDSASPASRQLNVMTAPLNGLHLPATDGDTLLWTMQPNQCALLVRSRRAAPPGAVPDADDAMLVGEWFGESDFGRVWDVAPSPDWRWLAYGQARYLGPADSSRSEWAGAAKDARISVAEVRRLARSMADGRFALSVPVVEPLLDGCAGDECELPSAHAIAGWRVGWSRDTLPLFRTSADPSDQRATWTAVDLDSLTILETRDAEPEPPLVWQSRAVADAAAAIRSGRSVLPAGAYEVESRDGTIVVRGPDRTGARRTRRVGPGAALATTANAQYILAVAPDSTTGRPRAVIYNFTLFHYRIASSCDR